MSNEYPMFQCRSCEKDEVEEFSYQREFGVCQECAEGIANHYNMAHGGRWLTWPNDPAPRSERKPISGETRFAVFRRDDFTCQICGGTEGELTVDHIVPVSKGGTDEMSNFRTACRRCNCSRGNRE